MRSANYWSMMVFVLALGLGLDVRAQASSPAIPAPSLQLLSRLPAIKDVSLSPDGKHIAAVTSPDGETSYVTIWATDDLAAKPVVISVGEASKKAVQQTIWAVYFIKNDRVLVQFRQLDDDANGEPEFLFRNMITDISGHGEWMTVSGKKDQNARARSQIFDLLPKDPRHILISHIDQGEDIYRVDIQTGELESISHGAEEFGSFRANLDGRIVARSFVGYEGGKTFEGVQLRDPTTGAFDTHFKWFAKDRDPIEFASASSDPDLVYLAANLGSDKMKIFPYHIRERKFDPPIFESAIFSMNGLITSNAKADFGEIIGVSVGDGEESTLWVDPKLDSIDQGLKKAFKAKVEDLVWTDAATGKAETIPNPVGASPKIVSMDYERDRFIVEYSGPNQPPIYYLFIPSKPLQLLAKSFPDLKPAALGDTRLVQYTARDGVPIPAFLTLPPAEKFGRGPYPAVVLPHGGPWARDERGWDITNWNAFFSSRGYAVIQPQYRGSQGWGLKLWKLGDKEWGKTMQDDNDDAVKWLVSQKLADPQKLAIFGYSYGGYAAIAGAIRPNGLYKCAIPAAGVMELATFKGETNEGGDFEREFQHETIDGMDPLQHAREVSIPVLLIHGDRDQTVNISESRAMYGALKSANKTVDFVTLKDWGHQLNKWSPKENVRMLEAIETFLKGPCGLQ